VQGFWLDRYPVANNQFLSFVTSHPEWRKTEVKPVFADQHYLESWPSDETWGDIEAASQPVTGVSWFAANAYCRAVGKTLPTTDQWEYALADNGRNKRRVDEKILEWYGRPNALHLPPVGQSFENGYGIRGLVGLVWEWTLDFNGAMSGAELRQTGKDKNLFCSGAGLAATDATDYASFLRYSMRASLKAAYSTPNLGFRCAKEQSR